MKSHIEMGPQIFGAARTNPPNPRAPVVSTFQSSSLRAASGNQLMPPKEKNTWVNPIDAFVMADSLFLKPNISHYYNFSLLKL